MRRLYKVSGVRKFGYSAFGIRYWILQPPMKLHWNDECRMTNDE
ncbi:hypothetical protein D1AOALGA4SA_3252 [Olavius algarvensis Delta 1 endosymbiont]|nr:hypothetical protein D1AOALGA4SA_3252 [Olavius algarvensis Delta 1 endosymbiont]